MWFTIAGLSGSWSSHSFDLSVQQYQLAYTLWLAGHGKDLTNILKELCVQYNNLVVTLLAWTSENNKKYYIWNWL